MSALEASDLHRLRQLLSSGADLNAPGRKISLSRLSLKVPSYPLIWAADVGEPEIVRLLLDGGADPNICCQYVHGSETYSVRPLCHANHPVVVNMLLDAGAEVNAQQRSPDLVTQTETALSRAAFIQPSVGKLLIERGADVNMTNVEGLTALYRAINYRHFELAAHLVQVRRSLKTLS